MFDIETLGLAQSVIEKLLARNLKMTTAESCTGGLVSAALTEISGASNVFYGGYVTYTYQAKTNMLGVPQSLIKANGAVSEQVARAMAEGAKSTANVDLAIAITGMAGPTSDESGKPIGLVHFGLALPTRVIHKKVMFGDLGRHQVRLEAVKTALHFIATEL